METFEDPFSKTQLNNQPQFSTLVDLVRYRALHQPHQTAYIFLQDGESESARCLTYQELDRQARTIAAYLQSQNAVGERALLLYPPGLEFIAAFFGCLYASVLATPAYPPRRNQNLSRLQAIVADADAKFVLTTAFLIDSIKKRLAEEQELVNLHCVASEYLDSQLAADWQPPSIESHSLGFLQYTSGSTGSPKGVMVSHRNLLHICEYIKQAFELTPESVSVSWLPPFHDMGLIDGVLQPIYSGFLGVVMPPTAFIQRPIQWLQAITRYRATHCGGPNFGYELCLNKITSEQRETLDLSSWCSAYSGAEPVRKDTLERFTEYFFSCGFRSHFFYPCYGMAETTLMVSGGSIKAEPVYCTVEAEALEQGQIIEATESSKNLKHLVGCGHSWLDTKVVIADPEYLTQCTPNQVGEIWVSGSSVTQGYWNRPEQTEATFKAYLADTGEGPFLRTGDLGFFNNGELYVTARLKDVIIIRGRNYYPQDIELTVQKSNSAFRVDCGVAFCVEVTGEERLVIAQEIERTHLRKLNVDQAVRTICKAVAEQHGLQVYAVLLLKTASIPKTSSGKIERYACRQGFLTGTLDVVGEWRQTANNEAFADYAPEQKTQAVSQPKSAKKLSPAAATLQSWLVVQLANELKIQPDILDVHEPFTSYGLDSVKAVSLAGAIEDWLGIKLSATIAYDYPSIEALAGYLADLSSSSAEEKQFKVHSNTQIQIEAIAIIGLGCRFPGANNPDEFWQLLQNGVDAITEVPLSRWQVNPSDLLIPTRGGFIADVDQFDPQFFGISPREAESMDPQQRLLLEVTWEALENGGQVAEQLAGSSTGVFIGIGNYDYARLQFQQSSQTNAYAATGNAFSIAANRLSYLLDLRGPSWAVDTACSSSLVAVHQACLSLQQGECQMALAGGVNLILTPELTATFTKAGMMAPDGRCKTFDASANGYVRGEGCGIAVLKRLSDALKDGDSILAVIKGTAINQDGRSNGLTAPNGPAQQAVIRQALYKARVTSAEIDYVEAHGTGTSLGDPIEVNAIKEVLMEGREPNQPAWIGSVKTNIGHLETAAGIAGLIKVVLALQHEAIPANLHLKQLNPHINLNGTSLAIPTEMQPWVGGNKKRLAGISSFGFGGTNAHIIVEEAPALSPVQASLQRPLHLFTLSTKSPSALSKLAQRYQSWLTNHSQASITDLCFTANTGRSHFTHRLAIITDSTEHLQTELGTFVSGQQSISPISRQVTPRKSQKIAFLFSGQGSQYVNMGRQLYETSSTFRQILHRCEEILCPYLKQPMLSLLYPDIDVDSPLDSTVYTQPAIFALEYALYQLWKSWGVEPDIVMGHSLGEYAAACAAGILPWEKGLQLVAQRANLMQALPKDGAMVAVFAQEAQVRAAIETHQNEVAIAAINGKQHFVLSGRAQAVEAVVAILHSQRIKTKPLIVSRGFHSRQMEPMLGEYAEILKTVSFASPHTDIVSNLTGKLATADIITPAYWCRHIRETVQFAVGMETLHQQGCDIFIEIGSHPILLGMGIRCLPKVIDGWLPSLRKGQGDWQSLLQSFRTLYLQGVSVDWAGFDQDYPRQRLQLPTYPFERSRYWLETAQNFESTSSSLALVSNQTPILKLFLQGNTEKLARLLTSTQQATDEPMTPKNVLENLIKAHQWQLQVAPLQNLLYQIQWQSKPNCLKSSSQKLGTWLIFADRGGLGQALAQQLQKQGHQCILVYAADAYQTSNNGIWFMNPDRDTDYEHLWQDVLTESDLPVTKILHLWSLETEFRGTMTPSSLQQVQKRTCGSVLSLVQSLAKSGQPVTSPLWLVTRGAISISHSCPSMAQAPLWGLGKVIALEHYQFWGGMIDLAPDIPANEVEMLLQAIETANEEDQLAVRDGDWYVPRLVPSQPLDVLPLRLRPDNTYLITGGLGALGLQVAQCFVQQGASHIVLIGRSEASPQAQNVLNVLKQQGVTVKVAQADVSCPEAMARLLEVIKTSMPPLRGVIHAAGTLNDGVLSQQTWERFCQVMAPKVGGAWNLHQLTLDLPLDFFVCFSSTAALLGSPGQANYAAANTFLDVLAHYRQGLGLPGLSINWGPWSGSGMAAGVASYSQDRWMAQGISPLAPEQGLQILQFLLGQDTPQVGVLQVDWSVFSQHHRVETAHPMLAEVVPQVKPLLTAREIPRPETDFLDQLKLAQSSERQEILVAHLQEQVRQILRLTSSHLLDSHQGFFDMGMDSLMAVEFRNRLESSLNASLPATLIFEFSTISELTTYLLMEVLAGESSDKKPQIDSQKIDATLPQSPDFEIVYEAGMESSILKDLTELETLLEKNRHE